MRLFIILLFFNASLFTFAQVPVIDADDWQNPAIFEKNQNAPHARVIPFLSPDEALSLKPEESPLLLSLDGTWKFLLADHPGLIPERFYEPGFDTRNWANITVPSNWEMEGFGHPKFRNIAMTIETKPPYLPDYHNPTGCYKRTFQLPGEWNGRQVMLRFEGIKSASYVWINGHPAGYNQGGFEPAEYNITPYLKPSDNDISVKVMRYSDGAFLENQDMWRLSGIFRSVALISRPALHIHDYYIFTEFDSLYRDANLHLEFDIENLSDRRISDYRVEIQLLDPNGTGLTVKPPVLETGEIHAGDRKKLKTVIPVKEPLKWSAEKPNLYTLLVSLSDPSGSVSESFAKKAGFRQTEVRNGALWVNGAMVKLNGVNSHMHHPLHGQAVPVETMREDLLIMKRFNINLVRTSHYPPSPEYLDLADELGMYIVCEAGTECHDNEYLSELPEWESMFTDRGVKMVYRDRNHPSVIFWSAGNEAGEGDNLKRLMEVCREIDPSRPHWMYGGNQFHIPFEDIVGPRYWRPLEIKNLAEGKVTGPDDLRPSFQDEYLAATGNGLGGLDEYWELIWKYPRLTGGAIWDWISPGIDLPLIRTPDESPLKNDPVIMGRPSMVEGPAGKAIRFSGHDDWVEFYRHPALDLDGEALTIEFKVKPEINLQPNTFLTKGTHQFGVIQPNREELEFYLHTGKRNVLRVKVPDNWYGEWQHVSAIYDGSLMKLYINYEKAGELSASGKILNVPYPICLGRNAELHDQGEFRGRLSLCSMDEVRIYNKALDIRQLQNQTAREASRSSLASLGFEETGIEGNFFGTGLGGRTYGIVWPDRAIQPEIFQIKRSAQPVLIEAADIDNGVIRLTNRFNFTDLDELTLVWSISINGIDTLIVQADEGPGCQPGESVMLKLDYQTAKQSTDKDIWLTLSFRLREDLNWAEKGHEVAWEQFLIQAGTAQESAADTKGKPPVISYTESQIVIEGERFTYILDSGTGTFHSMKYNDTELIKEGFDFSVWRAPLANDTDPWGSGEFTRSNFTQGLGRSIDNQLRTLGLENPGHIVGHTASENLPEGGTRLKLIIFTSAPGRGTGFEEHRTYDFSPDGSIMLSHMIIPHGDMPSLLPKTGLRFILPEEFNRVKWYGRGPFETYPDRKTGAKTGVWETTAEEAYVPYLIPQDYGNKTDVRWLRICNGKGSGFRIESSDKLLNFSLHTYDTDNLTRAVYPFQLTKPEYITLNVDYEVTGVGETARRALAKYRVLPEVKNYSLKFIPLSQ